MSLFCICPNCSYIEFYYSVLKIGNERVFQRTSSFLFFAYSNLITKKVGRIAMLTAGNNIHMEAALTAEKALDLVEVINTETTDKDSISKKDIDAYIRRMIPYTDAIPGTEPYFKRERNRLYAKLGSGATQGTLRWFFTNAQPDKYFAEIYINAVTSYRNVRQQHSLIFVLVLFSLFVLIYNCFSRYLF